MSQFYNKHGQLPLLVAKSFENKLANIVIVKIERESKRRYIE